MFRICGFLFAFVLVRVASADVWTAGVAVEPEPVFQISDQSLVYDANNRPHYFYGGSYLYHRYFDGANWRTEIVDPAPRVGRFARAVLAPNGSFHVVYRDEYTLGNRSERLRYATGTTGSWTTEEIPLPNAYVGALVVDSNNIPYFAARRAGTVLLVKKAGTWAEESVFTSGIESSIFPDNVDAKIVLGTGNEPHITYRSTEDNKLWHVSKTVSSWVAEVIAENVNASAGSSHYSHSAFARGTSQILHVCYTDSGSTGGIQLYCANNAGGTWTRTQIDNGSDLPGGASVGWYPSVKVGSAGAVHVSYYAWSQNPGNTYYFRYATNASGTWTVRNYQTSLSVLSPTVLALDNSASPVFGFKEHGDYWPGVDTKDIALKQLVWTGSSWSVSDIDTGTTKKHPVGLNTDIDIDSTGNTHLTFAQESGWGAYLNYATNRSGSWVSERFGFLGTYPTGVVTPQVRADQSGAAHIVFCASGGSLNCSLKYRTNASGIWVEADIAPIAWPTGSHDVPALGYTLRNGFSHVAFIARTSAKWELHYATNRSGVWVDMTVHDFGYDPNWTWTMTTDSAWVNLAAASNGDVHILFSHRDLRYAKIRGATIAVQTVLSPGIREGWGGRSLAVTETGVKFLAFEKSIECITGSFCPVGLRLYSDESGQWVESAIDSEIYFDGVSTWKIPREPAISVAGSVVKIAYFHDAYTHLRVATKGSCGYTSVVADGSDLQGGSEFGSNMTGFFYVATKALSTDATRVAYYDQPNGRVKTAQWSAPGVSLCTNTSGFANVVVNNVVETDVVARNNSGTTATVTVVNGFLSSPFTLVQDFCAGQVLNNAGTCSMRIRFSPKSVTSFHSPFVVVYTLGTGDSQAIITDISGSGVQSSGGSPGSNSDGGGGGGGGAGGGGCALAVNATLDPTLPMLILISSLVAWCRRKRAFD